MRFIAHGGSHSGARAVITMFVAMRMLQKIHLPGINKVGTFALNSER